MTGEPNPYVVVRREDRDLHFFGIDGFGCRCRASRA